MRCALPPGRATGRLTSVSAFKHVRIRGLLLCCLLCAVRSALAAERIQLRNGFFLDCDHREPAANGRVRLVLSATSSMDVDAGSIVSAEPLEPLHTEIPTPAATSPSTPVPTAGAAPLHTLIAAAGTAHNINLDLLQSVIDAESGGHVRAVSRTGAQGLMQLMPSTARAMGVHDSFAPEENLRGGTAYLDQLLTRYHDNMVLALAAYNAGPGAVDRYHGVPPYRETIAYVSRIVRELNRRTAVQQQAPAKQRQATLLGAELPGAELP